MSFYDNLAVIILAAGKGSRMKSDLAKVLHKVAGKSMVVHVIACARKIVKNHIHVVVGHQAQDVKDEISTYFDVHFAMQKELLGTGDAVKSALPAIDPKIENIMVLCGDVPLVQERTLVQLFQGHLAHHAMVTVLATKVKNPHGYGRLILDASQNLVCIREEADATETEKKINIVNAGIYCFNKAFLTAAIACLEPDNNQKEYYLTDVVENARKTKQKARAVVMDDPRQVIGVNTPQELSRAERLFQEINK